MYFFLSDISSGTITNEQSQHLWSMRIKNGDQVQVTNLQGSLATINITEVDKATRTINFEIISLERMEKYPAKTLYQAQTDKLYLEKLCEVAPLARITQITIFPSERSPKQRINSERLEKILIRSCEQSESVWKPELIISEKSTEEVVQNKNVIVLDEDGESKNYNHFQSILVGPEGGWSNAERDIFKQMQTPIHSLGGKNLPAWIAGYTYFSR
jgi:16S rRNA (uracil1498-N3)-methyltransferase